MPDFDVDFGGDFALDDTGDLAMVDGIDLDNQFIERDLLTAVNGYLWHPGYGAGLPQRVGRVALDGGIKAVVRSRLALLKVIAPLPLPVIDVQFRPDADGVCAIGIIYTNAVSNVQTSIALEVPSSR